MCLFEPFVSGREYRAKAGHDSSDLDLSARWTKLKTLMSGLMGLDGPSPLRKQIIGTLSRWGTFRLFAGFGLRCDLLHVRGVFPVIVRQIKDHPGGGHIAHVDGGFGALKDAGAAIDPPKLPVWCCVVVRTVRPTSGKQYVPVVSGAIRSEPTT